MGVIFPDLLAGNATRFFRFFFIFFVYNMTNSPLLTDQEEHHQLFPYKLISPDVQDALPDGYIIRPLQRDDYDKGNYSK